MKAVQLCFFLATIVLVSCRSCFKDKIWQYRNLFMVPIGGIDESKIPKIVGGQEAVPNSLPHQVFLTFYSSSGGWYCGGSLISNEIILTAAHCGEDATEVEIILGAHEPGQIENTQLRLVSTSIIIHESYNPSTITNDVGVIRLPYSVPHNEFIQPIKLASGSTTYAGSTARISGWGLTDGYGNALSTVLNYVDAVVLSNSACTQTYGNIIQTSTICTSGEQGKGSCNGDSGGPVVDVTTNTLIGVVSFGVQYCLSGYPSAHARVSSFQPWIQQHLN